MKIVFSVFFIVLALAVRAADWTVVASFDVATATNVTDTSAEKYSYTTSDIPATDLPAGSVARKIIFGSQINFAWMGATADAHYKIKATFLSDSAKRVQQISVNDNPLGENFALPQYQVLEREWSVPAAALAGNGYFAVAIKSTAGANTVLSRLEVLSDQPQTFLLPPPLSAIIAQTDVPMPRLSPRPTTVRGVKTPLVSLDGTWKFNPVPPIGFENLDAIQTKNWSKIEVPGEWVMEGFNVASNTAAGYWREFEVPKDWSGQRIKLRFDTVHSDCHVFVNGREVGAHEGCFTAFELDITDAVKPGRNTLVLAVKSDSIADVLASATQYAAHPLGGITRKVQLFALPPVNVASQMIETTFDPNFENATLAVKLSLADETAGKSSASISVRASLFDGKMFVDKVTQDFPIGTTDLKVLIPVTVPKKWDPEHPHLYSLKTELFANGMVTEKISQLAGFRQVEVRGNQLFVNGVPVKLRGACRHEVDPLRGRSLTPEDWLADAKLFRAANVNYIRTSHYPPPEEFLDLCDQYGFFVDCEAPLCWVEHSANPIWQSWNYQDPKFFPYLMRADYENLAANRNHPSIIMWSLANESRWSPLFAEVNRRMKLADPTRPTVFQDQCWGDYNNAHSMADIAVYHYPSEDGPAACDQESRPVLFDEYDHVSCYDRRELVTDPGVRDDWGRGLARMDGLMYEHEGCLGGAIWAGIDDVFCLPAGKFVGYGMWGCICDGWRREKPEFWSVKMAYSPIQIAARELPLPTVGGAIHVPVENRYNFANLSEAKIAWRIGSQKGVAQASVPARHDGEIIIQPVTALNNGDVLELTFTDPRGFVCYESKIVLGQPAVSTATAMEKPAGDLTLTETDKTITASGSDVNYVIDRTTGQFLSATKHGKTILIGGPSLMILPLQTEDCEPVDLGLWKPLNNICENWKATAVTAQTNDGTVEVMVKGSCDDATGGYILRLNAVGKVQVSYDFESRVKINPRQWGMVFFAPRNFDTLQWDRHAQWSVYPDDQIGRSTGTAVANVALDDKPYATNRPDHAWSQDATVLGGNDFTSTRENILNASLSSSDGKISLLSNGKQAVRAFIENGRAGLLVAGFYSGGGEGFSETHMAKERRPLQPGSKVADAVILQLAR